MRYLSSPESFSHPDGLGFSASVLIFAMIRRRSFLGRDSSSLTAEGLMQILKLPTFPQVFKDAFKGEVRFAGSFLESRQVFGVFSKAPPDRRIDKVRKGGIGLCRLVPQGPVDLGLEVNGRFLARQIHGLI